MRIVFSSPRFEPLLGGVETHTRELAIRLARRAHEVTVVTSNPDRALAPREVLDGVTIIRVPSLPKSGDPYFAPSAGRVVSRLDPDIVHVQGYQSAFTPVVLRETARLHLPTVMTFHGGAHSNVVRHALYPLQRRVFARSYRRLDALVVLTAFELQIYPRELKIPLSKFVQIPNGCDLEAPSAPVSTDFKLVTSLGRLEKAKGHDRVIHAFAKMLEKEPDLKLCIIGRGPDEDRLRLLVKELDLTNNVRFESYQAAERSRMACRLLSSGLVISMSKGETQPIAVMEAARLGSSVAVSTESAGMRDLVEARVAHPIDPTLDNDALASQMLDLLSSPFTPETTSLLTWEQCVDETESLYRNVLRTRNNEA